MSGFDMYGEMDVSTEDDMYFLRFFSEYNDLAERFPELMYENPNSENMQSFRKCFDLKFISNKKDDMRVITDLKKQAVELMSFTGKELGAKKYDELNVAEIVSTAKREGYALNCRYRTYIFTTMALSVGLKARMVSCMSMDMRYNDCHWVTEIYSDTYGKWIVVDVPLDFFYFDRRGIPLNLLEMRNRIISGKPIKMLSTNKEHIEFTQQYWKKNIFRFKFPARNEYNALAAKEQQFYVLNPSGFCMSNKQVIANGHSIGYKYYYNCRGIWGD